MAQDTNTLVLVGRLTKDAETKELPSGAQVVEFRLAFTSRVKRGEAWEDESGYVSVSYFARSEKLAGWLVKGKQVAVTGRLRFREWQAADGSKRSTLDVLANDVQLLSSGEFRHTDDAPQSDLPGEWGSLPSTPIPSSWVGEDIPFAPSYI